MAEPQLEPSSSSFRGYAGIHATIFEALRFLNHLEPADLNKMAAEDRICAICSDSLSDLVANQTWHRPVRLPECGHVFGKSCLIYWLTPFDRESSDSLDVDFHVEDEANDQEEDEGNVDRRWRPFWRNNQQAASSASEPSVPPESQWTPVNPRPHIANLDEQRDFANDEEVEEVEVEFTTEAIHNHDEHTTDFGEDGTIPDSAPWDLHPAAELVDYTDTPIDENGPFPQQPNDLYNYGSNLTGSSIVPLSPGSNTCPLCRHEVFPMPTHGDSLHCIQARIRVWDTAYKYLEFDWTDQESMFRAESLEFIHSWRRMRLAMGEIAEPALDLEQMRWTIQHALQSILGLHNDSESHTLVRGWTEERSFNFLAFAMSLQFNDWDAQAWFGAESRTLEYDTNPEVCLEPDARCLASVDQSIYLTITEARQEQIFDEYYSALYDFD